MPVTLDLLMALCSGISHDGAQGFIGIELGLVMCMVSVLLNPTSLSGP